LAEHGLIFRFILIFFWTCAAFAEAQHLSKETQEAVAPYLLPHDHPITPVLDHLFSSSRAILNLVALKQAGFAESKPRKFTKLIVTTHPACPGYIFKLYLDAQRYYKDLPEHHYWILRIQGANKIRRELKAQGIEHLFKVPQKWIYALPAHPQPPSGYYTKYYILVEEDMELFSKDDNERLWASSLVTFELLDHLYAILKKIGLRDCAKPDNIPFSLDGRIAFVDTQTFGSKKVRYKKLNPYLSPSNYAYWKTITGQ
jgi:hypothetical protein